MKRIAAIDVGTNTVLCLIAERRDGAFVVLEDMQAIPRLGRGVDGARMLQEASMERAWEALEAFARKAKSLGAEVIGVGTSALRDAANRDVFVERARRSCDAFHVISGEREAELTFRGACHELAPSDERVCVVDIGGGSTEFVIGSGASIEAKWSLDVGSVRLFERHLKHDPPTHAECDALMRDVLELLAPLPAALPPILACAGTATTVAGWLLGLPADEHHALHGAAFDADTLRDAALRLAMMSTAERAAHAAIEPLRADVLCAGALLLASIAERSEKPVRISTGGLRVGVALEARLG